MNNYVPFACKQLSCLFGETEAIFNEMASSKSFSLPFSLLWSVHLVCNLFT